MSISRLIKAIQSKRFAWEKYLDGGYWHGMRIQTMPLHCSYGLIGFTLYSPYGESFRGVLKHDFELEKTTYTE